MNNVRNILLDVDGDWDGTRPMAPAICRWWAGLYDDTWVWEGMPLENMQQNQTSLACANCCAVTRRMGFLLRELGSAFEAHAPLA
jgi:hypothetical protein